MVSAEYFDFPRVGLEAGFTEEQLAELYQRTLAEYHGDHMMAELRMLRTCTAVLRGGCTVQKALLPEPELPARVDFRVAENPRATATRAPARRRPERPPIVGPGYASSAGWRLRPSSQALQPITSGTPARCATQGTVNQGGRARHPEDCRPGFRGTGSTRARSRTPP